ncbi:MAG TPA: EAL domain-containing protein [Xanthobacteraceae bacterium]|nr:EAL domain-containing protein [Xanthobacteraceae bacterium]
MPQAKLSKILGAMSGSAVWRNRPIRYLILCGVTLIAAIVVGTAIMVDNLRDRALFDSQRELKNTALILAEQIDRSFQAVDLVQSSVIEKIQSLGIASSEDYARRMSGEDVQQMLKASTSGLVQIYAISLINADGRLINFSRFWPVPHISVADRKFFTALKSDPRMTSFISIPGHNRTDRAWTLFLTRKVTSANGEFLGLVLGAVELSFFDKLFDSISLGEGSSIALYRSDGILLTRFPQAESFIGKVFTSPLNALGGGDSATIRFVGQIGGKDRLLAVHRLADFPMFISVGVDTSAALAIWQKEKNTLLGAGALAALTVAIMFLLIVRQQTRAHNVSMQSLALEKQRLDAALNNMSQGLIMFDAAERIVVCNDLYIEMYGLSREIVKPGCSFAELLQYRAEAGKFVHHDIERYRADLLAAMAQGKVMSSILDTADGREVLVTNSPMAAGGRVATHNDITERRRAEAKIAYMAHHDALTDLPNRLWLYEQLRQTLARQKRGEHLAVFCLDLDRFKDVNDAHGHPVGDLLLKAVADRLRQCVRDTDTVARLGGDEFAIMQAGASQPTDATSLASRLIEAIGAPYALGGHQVTIELSIGIALAPGDGLDPDGLLKNADLALYRAKSDGRGLYRFFEPDMDARMQARRLLEIDLRKAIANSEFELFYQPLVDMKTEHVTGFEALIRWHHPERGMIAPLDFIAVAEETGLIVPIGDWVLHQACAEAAGWPSDVKIAVNLSSIQFKSKSLLQSVISALAASGLSPNRLELEITESVLLLDGDATLAVLHELRGLGVRISMDDFGTGYSSLSYLRKFPFDKIKIDQSFIFDMSDHNDSLAIIRAVIAMGSGLGIATTAEGVETLAQFTQLKLEGCTEVQGYLFSPPRPAAELKGLLASINPKLKAIA